MTPYQKALDKLVGDASMHGTKGQVDHKDRINRNLVMNRHMHPDTTGELADFISDSTNGLGNGMEPEYLSYLMHRKGPIEHLHPADARKIKRLAAGWE